MLPFKYQVSAPNGESLNVIARRHELSVEDLRLWNPQLPPAANSEYYIVRHSETIQLPPTLHYRGNGYGSNFKVGDFAQRLHETIALQNKLLKDLLPPIPTAAPTAAASAALSSSSALPLFKPPARKVQSKHELAQHIIATEAAAQVPEHAVSLATGGAAGRAKGSANAAYISKALEGASFAALGPRLAGVEQCFANCPRECLAPHNAALMAAAPSKRKPNHVSDDRLQTTPDAAAAPIDKGSDVRLNFCFFDTRSLYVVKEAWSVLGSQPLGALIDAIRCKTMLLAYHTTRNSFMFIGGTFYIDDRHEGYRDLTEELRQWDPVRCIVERLGDGAVSPAIRALQQRGYGACPVKKVSECTFADLRLRMNEFCVFRHCANCDHVFYLNQCGVVPASDHKAIREEGATYLSLEAALKPLESSSQFPRRTYVAPDRTINCDVCGKLPSNIATYGDAIAPFSPALFCLPCFRISHCDRDGNEINDGYVKLELPEGEFF